MVTPLWPTSQRSAPAPRDDGDCAHTPEQARRRLRRSRDRAAADLDLVARVVVDVAAQPRARPDVGQPGRLLGIARVRVAVRS